MQIAGNALSANNFTSLISCLNFLYNDMKSAKNIDLLPAWSTLNLYINQVISNYLHSNAYSACSLSSTAIKTVLEAIFIQI